MAQKIRKFEVQSGSAITLRCIRSDTNVGWGKKLTDGSVEIFIPINASELIRDKLVIEELSNLLSIKPKKIEILSGRKDYLIVTILDVFSEDVNKAFKDLIK